MPPKILVSSCLIGKKCAHDGTARTSDTVKELCGRYGYVYVCPEIDGTLGCPREACEITGGDGGDVLDGKARVMSFSGKDCTENFIKGAKVALEMAVNSGIHAAIMKSRSPSCGKNKIHSGKFDGILRDGPGVTAALLQRHGIKVFTEKEIDPFRQELPSNLH